MEVALELNLVEVKNAISAQTGFMGRWHLITPDGRLLDDPEMTVAHLLGR